MGRTTPFQAPDGSYYVLYATYLNADGRVYVGIRNEHYLDHKPNYIGCGIRRAGDVDCMNSGSSHFVRAVRKYGHAAFTRHNLLYFASLVALKRAEADIVTADFVASPLTFNTALGGGAPPVLSGEANGNYGNRWTPEMKQHLSQRFTGKRSLADNANARSTLLYDLSADETHSFATRTEAAEFLKLKRQSLITYMVDPNHVYRKRYLVYTDADTPPTPETIAAALAQSRYGKMI